jgi:hypothetical protein
MFDERVGLAEQEGGHVMRKILVVTGRTHDKRRGKMVRRFVGAGSALACALLLAGNVGAQPTNDAGFVMGDPSAGKLLPVYAYSTGRCDVDGNGSIDPAEASLANQCSSDSDCAGGDCLATGDLATIVGLENTRLNPQGRDDIFVHIEVFDVESNPVLSKTICLTQGDFGYLILQKNAPSDIQAADIEARCGPDSPHPTADSQCKATIFSEEINGIPSVGYVTFAARRARQNPLVTTRDDRACEFAVDLDNSETSDQDDFPGLYAWGVLQDVSEGFFGTEIPVLSAGVNFRQGAPGATDLFEPCGVFDDGRKGSDINGGSISDSDSPANQAHAGAACLLDTSVNATGAHFGGLISGDRRVGVRYDCNPANDSTSTLVAWAQNNYGVNPPIIARGEDEGCFNGNVPIPNEVNLVNLCTLAAVKSSVSTNQFRGAIEFQTPGTGGVDGFFFFTLITQADQNFVLTQLPYTTGEESADGVSIICPASGQ